MNNLNPAHIVKAHKNGYGDKTKKEALSLIAKGKTRRFVTKALKISDATLDTWIRESRGQRY